MKKCFTVLSAVLITAGMYLPQKADANNLQIHNVTLTGNNIVNQTIQVQFDVSWDNSWRDSINWDAAWLFVKFKDAGNVWHHATLSLAGFNLGTGTSDAIKISNDGVGAFIFRAVQDTGTFASTGVQLRWNYGANGVSDPSTLEVRAYGVEMVNVPQGNFGMNYYTVLNSGAYPIISTRMTPPINAGSDTIRIKGDAGMDSTNDGIVDNPNYPTGYKAFYCMKYEATEGQYADFLNTLTTAQLVNVHVAGSSITLVNEKYFASVPNRACFNGYEQWGDWYPYVTDILCFADWTGLRPMTIFEYNKSCFGPMKPTTFVFGESMSESSAITGTENGTETATRYDGNTNVNYPCSLIVRSGIFAKANTNRFRSGGSYYGIMEFSGNVKEPCVNFNAFGYDGRHGNGELNTDGNSDVINWNNNTIIYTDKPPYSCGNPGGFRYVRTDEN